MTNLPRQDRHHYPTKLKRCLQITWGCWLGLLLLLAGKWWLEAISGSLWVMQSIPLLVVLPGLWIHAYRAYSWLCFIVLLYFIPGVTGTMAPSGQWYDWVQLLLSFSLFFAATFASRWLQQAHFAVADNRAAPASSLGDNP